MDHLAWIAVSCWPNPFVSDNYSFLSIELFGKQMKQLLIYAGVLLSIVV